MAETVVYTTAGGVVLNEENQLLTLERTIRRNGVEVHEIRLPKGHIDPGETEEEAAVREVGEESGYWQVRIIANLGVAHSSFELEGIQYERDERYFLMRLTDEHRTAPTPVSAEEALFSPRWFSLDDAPRHMTYDTERAMAARARDYIQNRKSEN